MKVRDKETLRIKKERLRDEIHTETKIETERELKTETEKEGFIYYKMLFKLDI